MYPLKLKSLCKAKNMVNKTKWQSTEWVMIFTNPTFDRGSSQNIHKGHKKQKQANKKLKKLDIKIPNNPI